MADTLLRAGYLDAARALVASLEAGDDGAADKVIDQLTNIRETALFKELGTLTRELHESIKAFRQDSRLSDIAASEIPDARDRLNYVITMTEQAAHRTLTAIEDSVPLVDVVTERARRLEEQWRRFRSRELSVEEFRLLSREIEEFLGLVLEDGGKIHANLTDALMAQDYQDLTGQVIRRVISLVQEVEENLVGMVKLSGARILDESKDAGVKQPVDNIKAQGPAIPGLDSANDVVSGQDDVDDLLSSLGF